MSSDYELSYNLKTTATKHGLTPERLNTLRAELENRYSKAA